MVLKKGWWIPIVGALAVFLVGLLLLHLWTRPTEVVEEKTPLPFSMYNWRIGTSDDIIKVADICGKNATDDNVFLHVRQIDANREVWLQIGDGYEIKWRIGEQRITYSVKFSSVDYMKSYSSACTCVHNENGNVLRVDYPKNILGFLYEEKDFSVTILRKGATVDTYNFCALEPLVMD